MMEDFGGFGNVQIMIGLELNGMGFSYVEWNVSCVLLYDENVDKKCIHRMYNRLLQYFHMCNGQRNVVCMFPMNTDTAIKKKSKTFYSIFRFKKLIIEFNSTQINRIRSAFYYYKHLISNNLIISSNKLIRTIYAIRNICMTNIISR